MRTNQKHGKRSTPILTAATGYINNNRRRKLTLILTAHAKYLFKLKSLSLN